jgi:hypothetical protein
MVKFNFESDEEGITEVVIKISYRNKGEGLLKIAQDILDKDKELNTTSEDTTSRTKSSTSKSSDGGLFNFAGAKPPAPSKNGKAPPAEMMDFSKF